MLTLERGFGGHRLRIGKDVQGLRVDSDLRLRTQFVRRRHGRCGATGYFERVQHFLVDTGRARRGCRRGSQLVNLRLLRLLHGLSNLNVRLLRRLLHGFSDLNFRLLRRLFDGDADRNILRILLAELGDEFGEIGGIGG